MREVTIGILTWLGALFVTLIIAALMYALIRVTSDKVQEFRRSHKRKRAMERHLEELELRVSKLEGGAK